MREKAIKRIDDAFCLHLSIAYHCAICAQVLVWDDGDVTCTGETSADTRHISGDKEVEIITTIAQSHCDCDYCCEWAADEELQKRYASKEAYLEDVLEADFTELKDELVEKIENIPYGYFSDEGE